MTEDILPNYRNSSVDVWLKSIDKLKDELEDFLSKHGSESPEPKEEKPSSDDEKKPEPEKEESKPGEKLGSKEKPKSDEKHPSFFDVLKSKEKSDKKDDKKKLKVPPPFLPDSKEIDLSDEDLPPNDDD